MQLFNDILLGIVFNLKVNFINMVMGYLLVFFIYKEVKQKEKIFIAPTRWYYFFLLYYATELLSFIFSPYNPPFRRIGGDLWRTIAILLGFWYGSYISKIKKEKDKVPRYLKIFWIGGGIVAIYVIIQTLGHWYGLLGFSLMPGFRSQAFSGQAMTYSGSLIILISTLISYLLFVDDIDKKKRKLLWLTIIFLLLVALWLNETRSAELGIVFSLVFILIAKYRWKGIIAAVLTMIVIVLLTLATPIGSRWEHGYKILTAKKLNMRTSIGTRIMLWKFAWKGFKKSPIVGNGPGVFATAVSKEPYASELLTRCHAHNDYLQVLFASGLLGFITFMVFWLYPIYYFWKYKSREFFWKIAITSALLGIFVAGFFECNLFDAEIVMGLYFIIGSAFGFTNKVSGGEDAD